MDDAKKKMLKELSLLIWLVFLLPVGIFSIFNDSLMTLTFSHPAYFGIATIVVSLCYLYSSDFTKRDKAVFFIILSLGLISGKSKFYGFFTISIFFIFFFDNIRQFKLNLKNLLLICSMLAVTILVAWQKIYIYFFQVIIGDAGHKQDLIARFVLYDKFPEILKDYFPFGSGFASYATYASGEFYSDIYMKYGIDKVWGISKSFHSFISDTYYPSLAQFGVVGVVLFILFWVYIVKKAVSLYKSSGRAQSKYIVIVLMIVGYIAIECTTGSALVAQSGFFVMMMLGMILSDMQKAKTVHENLQKI